MSLKDEIEDMKKEVKDIQEHSFAMELLHDARKTNKRQFIIIIVILGMFTCLLGYTIWLLNDINYVETSEVYDMNTENGNNNYGGGRSRDSRGRYMESYGRRGVPGTGRGRYRGYDMIEEMGEHYGNYSEGRDTYGNDRETEKSFDKMLQSLEDFTYLIMQEADSQDKIEKVRKTARKISEM